MTIISLTTFITRRSPRSQYGAVGINLGQVVPDLLADGARVDSSRLAIWRSFL
jgi:hypothetical protein